VAQLLPNGLSPAADRAAFTVALGPASFEPTLGSFCPACSTLDGQTLPKPAFQSTLALAVPLPSGVTSAALASGRLDVALTNQLGFDPLRPGAGARGSLTLTLRGGSTVLGAPVVIHGSDAALSDGGSVSRTLDLAGTTLVSPLTLEVAFDSPAGDPVTLDAARRLTVTIVGSRLEAASAKVRVSGKPVASGESTFDLSDLGDFLRDQLKRGALQLTVANPFDVTGTLTLRMATPTTTILEPVVLGPGTQERQVELTREELRRIVGSEVVVSVSGSLWGPDAGVTVTPAQVLAIDAKLRVVLGPDDGE
jgi:hypothetical protein